MHHFSSSSTSFSVQWQIWVSLLQHIEIGPIYPLSLEISPHHDYKLYGKSSHMLSIVSQSGLDVLQFIDCF